MKQEDIDYINKKTAKEAETIVDTLFDKGFLNPSFKRKDLRTLEDLIALYISSDVCSHIKGYELIKSIDSIGE